MLFLPRFAIKFKISMSLTDALFMTADVIASMISAGDTEQDVSMPPVAALAGFMEDFLAIEFSIDFALSLEHAPNGVPEWVGEPVERGLFLNASAHAFFIGFEFDFRVLVELILPTPGLSELSSFAAFFGAFFSNPMGLVTGQIEPPKMGIRMGFEIQAECSLPLNLGYAYFFGKISISEFVLNGNAWLNFPGFPMYAYLAILVTPPDPPRSYLPAYQLDFGGELNFGPFGQVSAFGSLQTSPDPYFGVKGSFCKPLIGPFVFSGSLAVCMGNVPDHIREWCEFSNSIAFEARTRTGFLGEWHVKGLLAFTPFVMRASVELTISFADMIMDLIFFIIKVITGTSEPEKSPVGKALNYLFQAFNFIKGGKVSIDTSISLLELTLKLNLMGTEVPLSLPLPLPGRRHLEQLEQGVLTMAEGQLADPAGWPHPDDVRLNATRRRAQESACAGVPGAEMTIEDIINKIGEFFSNPMKLIETIAPIDFSFAFSINIEAIGLEISGSLHFIMEKSGYMQLDLAASMTFLGIGIEGEVSLSTTGGIVYARLTGTGSIPALCGACPSLDGRLDMVKERSGTMTVSMEISLTLACFNLAGAASLSTDGGLRYFWLKAGNPLCFLDPILDMIRDNIPGGGVILDMIDFGVKSVYFGYSGTGNAISFELVLIIAGQEQTLSFIVSTEISSVMDLIDMVISGIDQIFELLDQYLNIFTLTFIDATLGHEPKDWSGGFGDRNMGGSGQGAGADGSLKLANTAYARVGLFGAAFGIDLDNSMKADLFHSGKTIPIIDAVLALKIDAQIKNPIASDLANMISDVARTVVETVVGVLNDVTGLDLMSIPSLNKDALRVIIKLRNAVCTLRDAFGSVIATLNTNLGEIGTPNPLSTGLPAILNSMSLLMDGIEIAISRGEIARERMPEFQRLGGIIDRIIEETTDYFRNPQVLEANSEIRAKMVVVRDMLADAYGVPGQAAVLISALGVLLDILTLDEAAQLEALATWGVVVRARPHTTASLATSTPHLNSCPQRWCVPVVGRAPMVGRPWGSYGGSAVADPVASACRCGMSAACSRSRPTGATGWKHSAATCPSPSSALLMPLGKS